MRISSTASFWPVSPIRKRTSRASRGDVEPGHARDALVEAQQRGEDADGRRLSRAVGTEQAAHRALRHGEVEAVEGDRRAVPLAQSDSLDRQTGYAVRHNEYTVRSVRIVVSSDFRISLQLLWGRRERDERGPKPGLTVERIVAGGDRARRRRRARRGVDAARRGSAWRRRDVALPLRARQDRAARPDARRGPRRGLRPSAQGDWREQLAWLARRSRARIQRHPWMLQVVIGQRPPLGPNIIGDFDAYLRGGRPASG